jgi:hypothetical protein
MNPVTNPDLVYSQSLSYLSASLSWYQAPTWDLRPICPILSLIIFFFDSFGFVDVERPF